MLTSDVVLFSMFLRSTISVVNKDLPKVAGCVFVDLSREQRPYRCEQCDVGFKLRVHLKKHNLYRHTDVYQCECRHCGKRFKDSSAVRLHERIHSTDRPFPCPTCGKTFKTRENLWGHRHRGPCGLLNQVSSL